MKHGRCLCKASLHICRLLNLKKMKRKTSLTEQHLMLWRKNASETLMYTSFTTTVPAASLQMIVHLVLEPSLRRTFGPMDICRTHNRHCCENCTAPSCLRGVVQKSDKHSSVVWLQTEQKRWIYFFITEISADACRKTFADRLQLWARNSFLFLWFNIIALDYLIHQEMFKHPRWGPPLVWLYRFWIEIKDRKDSSIFHLFIFISRTKKKKNKHLLKQ